MLSRVGDYKIFWLLRYFDACNSAIPCEFVIIRKIFKSQGNLFKKFAMVSILHKKAAIRRICLIFLAYKYRIRIPTRILLILALLMWRVRLAYYLGPYRITYMAQCDKTYADLNYINAVVTECLYNF